MAIEYTNSQMEALIREHVHNERNRQILTQRLICGRTYANIAEGFGLSDRQISRIVSREAARLYKYL